VADATAGPILAATICVADISSAEAAYARALGYKCVHRGRVPERLAAAWRAPAAAGSSTVTMAPADEETGSIRLVERPRVGAATPLRVPGWRSVEIAVRDVDALAEDPALAALRVVARPRGLGSAQSIRAMQLIGRGGEVVNLTSTAEGTPWSLPPLPRHVGGIFMVSLSTHDLPGTVAFYCSHFKATAPRAPRLAQIEVIDAELGLPADTRHMIRTVQLRGRALIEVDAHPLAVPAGPEPADDLKPGLAFVTLAVDSIDALPAALHTGPAVVATEPPYSGRRACMITGAAGELAELVETGSAG
jgi:hypothetical protein